MQALHRELDCSICYECYDSFMRIPLILKCGHTFCKICIDNLIEKRRSQFKFYCPTCRQLQ